jgi:glycosyltransferase involved in cell wall biosynthesis
MRVAFLASRFLDPENSRSWSGLPFFMRRALEQAGVETIILATNDSDHSRRWAHFLLWRWLRHRRYLIHCDARLLRNQARQFERRLAGITVDAVFSPSTWSLAYLETELPTLFWTDACFGGLLGFYESFTDVAPPSIAAGHSIEQRALTNCTRAIYSSAWAAETAQEHYRIDSRRISIIPFGGNLHEPPTLLEVGAFVKRRDASPCRLLLVGVDWKRKGADIAVEAAVALEAAGLKTILTVVGCAPPGGRTLPACVELVPFIGKDTADQRRELAAIYARSHFFIMPSRAEAFGLVFAEASAFGVPCLAADVGGLSSVITDDVNGHLFPFQANGSMYADYILRLMRAPDRYRELALNAAQEANDRLSWKAAGRRVAELLYELQQPAAPREAVAAKLSSR